MTVTRGLEHRLVLSGALRKEAVQMALRRQKVYGGGLDTVLLEMGLVDEGTVWALLVEEAGLPPLPPTLLDGPEFEPELLIGPGEARRLGAFIFRHAQHGGGAAPQVVGRPGFDSEAVTAALEGRKADIFIVPEVRFEALLGAYYRQPVPPRFLSLLGRLMGAEQVRRWAAARAPRTEPVAPPIDLGPRFALQPSSVVGDATTQEAAHPEMQAVSETAPSPPLAVEPSADAPSSPAQPSSPQRVLDDIDVALETLALGPGARSPNAPGDGLLAALELFAELEGGPRSASLAAAIASRWSSAEIFSLLPMLAKRGEQAARAALPLLAARSEDAHLLLQWLTAESPRERFWAALGLEPYLSPTRPPSVPESAGPQAADVATKDKIRETLCGRLEREKDPDAALALARALRAVARHPDVQTALTRLGAIVIDSAALDPVRAHAAALIGQLRSETAAAMEPLIAGVAAKSPQVGDTCQGLLVRMTGFDAGKSRSAWQRWWRHNQHRPRRAWLVDGLAHKRAEIRLAAAHELWELTGQTLGYHFDLPAGTRAAAVARWKEWLEHVESGGEGG